MKTTKKLPVRTLDTRPANPPHGAKLKTVSPQLKKKVANAAGREIRAAIASQGLPTDVTMAADTFNVMHCRVALNDGISPHADTILAREKLFGVIATLGWERTVQVLASCARLFAEVPVRPLEPLSPVAKEHLHILAQVLDGQGPSVRQVDREITKG